MEWRSNKVYNENISYHVRMKHLANDQTQPVYYLKLPPNAQRILPEGRNEIHSGMVDMASELLRDMIETLERSADQLWLCVKGPATTGRNYAMEVLEAPQSKFKETDISVIPRRSATRYPDKKNKAGMGQKSSRT
ncbi:hypothetical protein Dda_7231 [Drechslerella dactyloides]|uniref:Uncharacterized protein n=1 Tax=Drechslerella dactyloides TaxID=74499 RepID=A0AAD6IS72_DREDA|nr:hypothetical protein Dda_7231 [Drechslerella dactyloides]